MGDSLVWRARNLISTCTGYLWTPTWRTEANALLESIRENLEAAEAAADVANDLLTVRTLTIGGGMTALRGAVAQASVQARNADAAQKLVVADAAKLRKLLTENKGDLNEMLPVKDQLADAVQAKTTANAAWQSLREAGAPSEQWHALAARLNGPLLARLDAVKALPGAPSTDALFQTHSGLCAGINMANGPGGWNTDRVVTTVQKVTQAANKLEVDIGRLEAQAGGEPDTKLAAQRKSALARYDKMIVGYDIDGVVKAAVGKLQETDPRVQARHLTGATGNQAAIRNRLNAALDQCATPAEIASALETALKRYRDSVADFATRVQNESGLPQMQTKATAAVESELDAARFEKMKPEVEKALSTLRGSGAPSYSSHKKRYDELVEATYSNQTYKTAVDTTLPKMLEAIEGAFYKRLEDTADETRALEERASKLRQQLETIEKRRDAQGAKAVIVMIRANLDEADNFIDCKGNLEAAEPATAILDDVEKLLKDFSTTTSEFASLNQMLGAIETGLGQADLKLIPVVELAGLTQRLAQLKDPKNGLSSTEFKADVAALKLDLDKQAKFAGDLKAWRLKAAGELNGLNGQFQGFAAAVKKAPLTDFPSGKPDPSVGLLKSGLDTMQTLLTAVVGADDFTQHTESWATEKGLATTRLEAVWDDRGKLLKDKAEASKDATDGMARAEEIQRVTERCTALTLKAQGLRGDIAKAMGNMGEFDVLTKQLTAVSATIADDPAKAVTILDDIERRLQQLPGAPDFNAAILRNIGKVPGQWAAVLDQTRKNIDALQQAITTTVVSPPFKDNLGELAPLFTKAKMAFPADAFTGIADALTAPDPKHEKTDAKRAKREEGLRLVRHYQAQLLGDPLFLHLQKNPFGVPLFGQLFRFLDRVELELLRVAA